MEHMGGSARHDAHDETVRRLRALIVRDEFRPGDVLGSERDLARSFGVSRSALRTTLGILESRHEIIRKIGRSGGIVVADNRLERNINTSESLPVIAKRQGFVVSSKVIASTIAQASASDRRLLGLRDGRNAIYAITRLRYIDGDALSVEDNHLPAALFPMLLTRDLSESLYAQFESGYGIHPADVDETLETVRADETVARSLHIAVGSTVMRVQRVARDEQGRPFERATELYNASRIRFTMHHSGYVRLSATTTHPER